MGKDERHAGSAIFLLKEKLMSISGDYWIEDEHGTKRYKVDGKALRLTKELVLEDASGAEVCTVKHRMAHLHRTIEITRGGQELGVVQAKIFKLRPKYTVELASGEEVKVEGGLSTRHFDIERGGQPIAHALHKWATVRDTVAIEVFDPADTELVLGVVLAVDMSEEFDRKAI